ncbi:MAG TPA: helix-turn-helix domain-containing protein [Gemmataceae bacterium]|nr:helix-turn-helix domain-containing protein [Gemmataceae bacterium]
MATGIDLDGFMTVADACEYLALSRARINSLIKKGELPVVVYGERTRVVPRKSVVEFARRKLEEATSR